VLIPIDIRRELALGSLLLMSCAPQVAAERAERAVSPAPASSVAAGAPRHLIPIEHTIDALVSSGPAPAVTSQVVKVSAGGGTIIEPGSPEDSEWVSDCNGGQVRAPLWLTRVPVWAALCVHAPAKVRVNIDVGTNLVAHEGLGNGDAVSFYQVYYSLSKVRVMPNEKQVVWAVCGGGGINLQNGDRVVPASLLPPANAEMLVKHVNQLIQINTELNRFWRLFRNSTVPADKKDLKVILNELDLALTDAGGLLRAALIKENHLALAQPAGKLRPIVYPPPIPKRPNGPKPPTPNKGGSVIPKPKKHP
jgi:hypothetical protein